MSEAELQLEMELAKLKVVGDEKFEITPPEGPMNTAEFVKWWNRQPRPKATVTGSVVTYPLDPADQVKAEQLLQQVKELDIGEYEGRLLSCERIRQRTVGYYNYNKKTGEIRDFPFEIAEIVFEMSLNGGGKEKKLRFKAEKSSFDLTNKIYPLVDKNIKVRANRENRRIEVQIVAQGMPFPK